MGFLFLLLFSWSFQFAYAQSSLEDQVLRGEEPDLPSQAPPDALTPVETPVNPEERKSVEREKQKLDESLAPQDSYIPKDHVFVVQRRYINKEGAHEVTPFWLGIQPADSFRVQSQLGFTYAYHFSETLAVEALNFHLIQNYSTDVDAKIFKVAGVRVDRVEPVWSLGGGFLWSPFRAKSSANETVNYFEGYFSLGGAYTKFAEGSQPSAYGGVGFRLFINRRSLLKSEFRDYLDLSAKVKQRPNFLIGMSVLFSDFLSDRFESRKSAGGID